MWTATTYIRSGAGSRMCDARGMGYGMNKAWQNSKYTIYIGAEFSAIFTFIPGSVGATGRTGSS